MVLLTQERLTFSRLPLKDGGAKIAQRIATLSAEIASVRSGMPTGAAGMRGSSAPSSSLMVPVTSLSQVTSHPLMSLHCPPEFPISFPQGWTFLTGQKPYSLLSLRLPLMMCFQASKETPKEVVAAL